MITKNVLGCLCALTAAGLATAAHAQAPASAQVWDVRLAIQDNGRNLQLRSPGGQVLGTVRADVTEVRITLQARVAIRPGTWNTTNLGVSRVGGPNGSFFMIFTESSDSTSGFSTISRGLVPGGTNYLGAAFSADSNGDPFAGTNWAFRQGFGPAFTGGSNSDIGNGILSNEVQADGTDRGIVTSVVNSRSQGYNGVPLGVANITGTDLLGNPILSGAYADLFTMTYRPKPSDNGRTINFQVTGQSARYLFKDNGGGNASSSSAVGLQQFFGGFAVPTPGGAAVLGLAGLAAGRRRRA